MPKTGLRSLPARSHVSKAVAAANPHLFDKALAPLATERLAKEASPAPRPRKPMNKTEQSFSLRLEAMVRRGDILKWEREGITLRWPDGMTYTPDFTVIEQSSIDLEGSQPNPWPFVKLRYVVKLRFIEVKGPRIEEDALVKFRAARAYWPLFEFQMWQKKRGEWAQIL